MLNPPPPKMPKNHVWMLFLRRRSSRRERGGCARIFHGKFIFAQNALFKIYLRKYIFLHFFRCFLLKVGFLINFSILLCVFFELPLKPLHRQKKAFSVSQVTLESKQQCLSIKWDRGRHALTLYVQPMCVHGLIIMIHFFRKIVCVKRNFVFKSYKMLSSA